MRNILLSTVFLALAACSQIPSQTYFERGSPESLLDSSSEVVKIRLSGARSINELTDMINRDQPTRAEVRCLESDKTCRLAKKTLKQFAVPVDSVPAADNRVTLFYNRMAARDCENRFIDNHINPYNLNHPTFGCSIAANMAQQITDKQQITNPPLKDYYDGEKGVQVYENYLRPPAAEGTDTGRSVLDGVRSSSQ